MRNMATEKTLDRKPYAGNPHVRFDEGVVASVATPRRGSLFYRIGCVIVAACAAVLETLASAGSALPLVGDGVADDTAAIQARLDSGAACVYLPPPKDHYVISRTLKIGSEQELRLDRFTRIRLAPQSNCPMLENRTYRAGTGTNVFVAVTGGIWDMDNRNQRGNFMQDPELAKSAPKKFDPDFFFGMSMRFCHVERLTVCGVTVRNPVNYGIEFGHVSYVTADDITFDYRQGNPKLLNMDGLHFDGFCHHLRITNVRGTCYDDMIALNANDGMCSPEEGPISDVDIDGLYCDYCHSAVRLLSADAPISRVTIRNVHGNFYVSAVWLTHHFRDRPAPGRFDDIVISDVFAAKAIPPPDVDCPWRRSLPLIYVEGVANIGSLVMERIFRDERTLTAPTFGIDRRETHVDSLVIRDCRMTNALETPIPFIEAKGKVKKMTVQDVDFAGRWTQTGRPE